MSDPEATALRELRNQRLQMAALVAVAGVAGLFIGSERELLPMERRGAGFVAVATAPSGEARVIASPRQGEGGAAATNRVHRQPIAAPTSAPAPMVTPSPAASASLAPATLAPAADPTAVAPPAALPEAAD